MLGERAGLRGSNKWWVQIRGMSLVVRPLGRGGLGTPGLGSDLKLPRQTRRMRPGATGWTAAKRGGRSRCRGWAFGRPAARQGGQSSVPPQLRLVLQVWADMLPKEGAVGHRDHAEGSPVLWRSGNEGGTQDCISPGQDAIGV